jgi:transposase
MVVGVVLDGNGRPLCCEMWPGNTTDVKTLIPVVNRVRDRFNVSKFCVVADRGMISKETLVEFEKPENKVPYILGTRMRNVSEVKRDVLSRAENYQEVVPEGTRVKDPSPLKVQEVWVDKRRYIICVNSKQARKDAADRESILASLEEQLKNGPKALVGNRGYRRYLKFEKNSASIDREKVEQEAKFDGKWVLRTNTRLSAKNVALKYKELWQVEHTFRDMKSVLETRPIYHRLDETIRGHVFCSFLALMLKKDLYRRLEDSGHSFEWAEIKQDLKALTETVIEEDGKCLAVRSQCKGTCGKVFQSVGVAIPPTIREI